MRRLPLTGARPTQGSAAAPAASQLPLPPLPPTPACLSHLPCFPPTALALLALANGLWAFDIVPLSVAPRAPVAATATSGVAATANAFVPLDPGVLYESMSYPTAFIGAMFGGLAVASYVRTGQNAAGYSVDSITMPLGGSVLDLPCSVTFDLWLCDATGVPTRRVRTLPAQPLPLPNFSSQPPFADVTFTFDPPAVLMSTRWYALVVRPAPIDRSGKLYIFVANAADPQADLKDVGWTE